MSMETDILSQNNRDKIKALTQRLDKLENVGAENEVVNESAKQIIKLWDSVTIIATALAEVKQNLKHLEKFFSNQQDQINDLKPKKPKAKNKKRKKAA